MNAQPFWQLTAGGLTSGAVYALIGLGFALVVRVSRVMNLAQGQYYTLAALLEATALTALGWPLWLAVGAAVAVTGGVGVAVDWLALRPARRTDVSSLLVITLGVSTFLTGLAQSLWGSNPVALPAFSGNQPVQVLGATVVPQVFWALGGMSAVVVALMLFLDHTDLGKALTAVAELPATVQTLGVRSGRLRTLAFFLSAAVGGLAGVLAAPLTFVTYDGGLLLGLKGFVAAVLGGVGNPLGAVLGGLGLGLAEGYGGFFSSLYQGAIPFLVLLAVLVGRSYLAPAPVAPEGRKPRQEWIPFGRRSRWVAGLLTAAVLTVGLTGGGGLVAAAAQAGIFALAAEGLQLMQGQAGLLSIGQGAFMAIGAYATAVLTVHAGLSPWLGMAAGVVLAALVAAVVGLATLRLSGYNLAIATLALAVIADTVATGWRSLTGGASGLVGVPAIGNFGPRALALVIWLGVALGAAVLHNLNRSQVGRALKAIRQDEVAAATSGIPVARYKVTAFLLGSLFGALAGSLEAQNLSLATPSMIAPEVSIALLVTVFVGGETSILAPAVGAVVLQGLTSLLAGAAQLETMVQGILLVLVMAAMPQGLLGLVEHRRRPAPVPTRDIGEMGA